MVVVGDHRVLVAVVEEIQFAVGFLLGLVEPQHIELITVREAAAKQTHGTVGVAEDKAAEVADEELRAATDRDEVVFGPQVGQFCLQEPVVQCPVGAEAGCPVTNVGTDDRQFVDVEVVEVEDRCGSHPPDRLLVAGTAVEQVDREPEEVRAEELLGISEELLGERVQRALERGRSGRDLPKFLHQLGNTGDCQEGVLADQGVVTLQDVEVVRIPPTSQHSGVVVDRWVLFAVTVPGRHSQSPAILDRDKVTSLLILPRQHSRGTTEPKGSLEFGNQDTGGLSGFQFGSLTVRIGSTWSENPWTKRLFVLWWRGPGP